MQSWLPRTAYRRSPNGVPVALLEGGELLGQAVRGQVALGDHGRERIDIVAGDQLGDGRPVHQLRVRRRAGRHAEDRTALLRSDAAGLGLAEVDVVDRGEPATKRTDGTRQRRVGDAVVLVRRRRFEPVDDDDLGAAVEGRARPSTPSSARCGRLGDRGRAIR